MDSVRIDFPSIPDHELDRACSILAASIPRLLADPKIKQEYEEWKAGYLAEKANQNARG